MKVGGTARYTYVEQAIKLGVCRFGGWAEKSRGQWKSRPRRLITVNRAVLQFSQFLFSWLIQSKERYVRLNLLSCKDRAGNRVCMLCFLCPLLLAGRVAGTFSASRR